MTVPRIHPAYFSLIVTGVADALYEHDMRIVLCPTLHDHDREVSLLERLVHGTIDGGLLILPEESTGELQTLMSTASASSSSTLASGSTAPCPTVSAANSSGRDQATRHLLELGHRRIAAITGPRGWLATEERTRGYLAALAAAGIDADDELMIESNFDVDGGRAAAEPACSTCPSRRRRSSPSTTRWRSASMQTAFATGLTRPG